MKKETIATIVQLVEDRAAANAKIAELERQLARERDEVDRLRTESEEAATASDEATILLEKDVAELKRQLAEACRDASAPADASVRTGEGRGSGLDNPEALRESVRVLTRQRDQASYRTNEMTWERDRARDEAEKLRATMADSLEAAREEHEETLARALKAEQERDEALADIEAAWDAYPLAGSARKLGAVTMAGSTLAEVVAGLLKSRDKAYAETDRRGAELSAALQPDGWECALSDDELRRLASSAYHGPPILPNEPAMREVAKKLRDAVLANLRRKGATS